MEKLNTGQIKFENKKGQKASETYYFFYNGKSINTLKVSLSTKTSRDGGKAYYLEL